MNGQDIPMNIIPVRAGEKIALSKTLHVTAFATEHRVASLGYAVSQTHTKVAMHGLQRWFSYRRRAW